eukprot:1716080-Lingulodinium_polyedra.AAC.1
MAARWKGLPPLPHGWACGGPSRLGARANGGATQWHRYWGPADTRAPPRRHTAGTPSTQCAHGQR